MVDFFVVWKSSWTKKLVAWRADTYTYRRKWDVGDDKENEVDKGKGPKCERKRRCRIDDEKVKYC